MRKRIIAKSHGTSKIYAEFPHYDQEDEYWVYVDACIFRVCYDIVIEWTRAINRNESYREIYAVISEYYRNEDIVSMRVQTMFDFPTAAHPVHDSSSLNFGGKDVGQFSVADLLYGEETCETKPEAFFDDKGVYVVEKPSEVSGVQERFRSWKMLELDWPHYLAETSFFHFVASCRSS